MPERILVIDDEPDLVRLLVFNLQDLGYDTQAETTGEGGLAAAIATPPSVILLDVMLPDLPGTEVCRRLRAEPHLADVAILMLTARGEEEDRVLGFEAGADDYVVKPYSVREVCLRVQALARRVTEVRAARSAAAAPPAADGLLRWRRLSLDVARHRVMIDDRELSLRPLEFKLLAFLFASAGRVFGREDILEAVWGTREGISTRTVDVHVRRLRERLGDHAEAVETVPGFGYRLREE